jgi:hypothetical protein
MPMQMAIEIISTSNARLWMMLIPKMGRLTTNKGKMAQWIAQASELIIPRASQLILIFGMGAKIIKRNYVAKIR